MKAVLTQCAWAATRKKGSYYQAKYRALISRMGKKKALLAIGHKILCVIYLILKTRQPYQEFGVEQFERQRQQKRIAHLKQELKDLGIAV